MTLQSHTPDNVEILPRNREHELSDSLAGDWYDNHPFKTAFYNAMSITFPLGEKFFIDSVRTYAERVSDPKLQQEVSGFCGQEGYHRREHARYNQVLCDKRGYDLEYLEGRLEKNIALSKKLLSPMEQLASTAALEHITAIMAESWLDPENPETPGVEPAMRELWDWHAAEEMEHKAVAFDVYRAMGGTEKMRCSALRQGSWFLLMDVAVGVVHMLRRDGKLWNLKVWREGCRFLLAENGVLRRLWPSYKQWFEEGFHPWQRDTRELLTNWEAVAG